MKFQSFILDDFQVKAIQAVQKNQTVVVSASTGTGKTIIAEYIIDTCIKEQKNRVVYTAPIKALSNQKYRDFTQRYGHESIGILTGDVVINAQAPILIMTTEIYRNMLISHDPIIEDISYVIFDEIHFMNDPERGTVWEEALLFSPASTRFLCLSATIPNAYEFSSWLNTIKDHVVTTIIHTKRTVPLHHFIYKPEKGMVPIHEAKRWKTTRSKKKKKGKQHIVPVSLHQLIGSLQNKLPAIIFSFSRKQSEETAEALSKRYNYIKDEFIVDQIQYICSKYFTKEINQLASTKKLISALKTGIGYHHAGLLPQQRFAVEELFSNGFLHILCATETFAVGINMPAKTVILNGIRKFDGHHFRLINATEYFQLAGRAGRRGIDTAGFVVTVPDPRDKLTPFFEVMDAEAEPIQSQFQLSYNTILNLLDGYNTKEIDLILRKNFYAYRKQHRQQRTVRMKTSFTQKCKQLQMMRYITSERKLTEKGQFAKNIYFEEIAISELFATSLYTQLTNVELLQIIAAIIYERRPNDHFSFKGVIKQYNALIEKCKQNKHFFRKLNKLSLKRMMGIITVWSRKESFQEVLSLTSFREGDLIRLFRRIIDMLQQIKRATNDDDLIGRINECIELLDRDLVRFEIAYELQ